MESGSFYQPGRATMRRPSFADGFLPALSETSLQSDALGQSFRLKVTNAALRTLDIKGGLDPFLVKAKDEVLSLRARRIKKQLKAKLAETAAAA